MGNLRELSAFIKEDGETKEFYLTISHPQQSQDAEDYFCNIHSPRLFKRDKKIFGTDAEQATDLAINFVRSLLSTKALVDEQGNSIDFK